MSNKQQATSNNRQSEYVCLVIHNQEYGIKTSYVKAILDTPAIRQVPKAPPFVAGVANIRGRIVPLLNPVKRFELTVSEEQSPITNPLVLVQLESSLYGIMVDRIASMTYLSEEMIEAVNPIMVDKEAAFIAGMAKYEERLIHVLDLEAFIRAGIASDREEMLAYEASAAKMSEALKRSEKQTFRRYLSLVVADEQYGVDLSALNEVIPVQRIEKTDAGPEYLVGIVKAKDGIFPVIDLQKKFDLDPVPYTENSRIVVIDAGEYPCGLLANSVTEILNIIDEDMKDVPAMTSGEDSAHIKGVAMLEEGKKLLILLNENRVLTDQEVKSLHNVEELNMSRNIPKKKAAKEREFLSFVTFNVADVEFAFSLRELSEVIDYQEPTRVPKAPPFVRGLVAVRGELAPVVDLRARFDLSKTGDAPKTRILIVRKGNTLYGVVADSIAEILRVTEDDLVPPPSIVKGIESECMDRIIMLKETDRTPIVLNIEAIFTTTNEE